MFSSIFRRTFSTTVRELGSELNLSSLKLSESQKYFKLERLSDFEEVVQAPEGSVVLVDSEVPTQFQQGRLLLLIKRLILFFKSWKQLES